MGLLPPLYPMIISGTAFASKSRSQVSNGLSPAHLLATQVCMMA